jgi:hypothetical protein
MFYLPRAICVCVYVYDMFQMLVSTQGGSHCSAKKIIL